MDEHGMFSKLTSRLRELGSAGARRDRVGSQELTLNERAIKLERRPATRAASVVPKKGRRGK
jgi:hypothetical protein